MNNANGKTRECAFSREDWSFWAIRQQERGAEDTGVFEGQAGRWNRGAKDQTRDFIFTDNHGTQDCLTGAISCPGALEPCTK
jgi:hypothetical protein